MSSREDRGEILILASPGSRQHSRLGSERSIEQILGAEEEEVHAERLGGELARPRGHLRHLVGREPRRTDDAEAAGLAHGACQLAVGHPVAHPATHDRVLDADEPRERRLDHAADSSAIVRS